MKKLPKKVFSIIAVCVLVFGIMPIMTACTIPFMDKKEPEQEVTAKIPNFEPLTEIKEGQPNIYLIVKVLDSSYWQVIVNGVKDAGNQYNCNIYYSGTANETDWQGQKGLIEKAMEQNPDGIIIAPDDSTKLTQDLKNIHDKGIPIALVDTVVNEDVFDVIYMTDNFIAGQNAAEEMISQLEMMGHAKNDPLTVGILVGSASSQTINERLAGFYQYWSENAPAKWEIINDIKNCNGDVEYACELTKNLIEEYPQIAGLYGTNNGPTRALCSTVMNMGKMHIVVVGFDYSDEMKAMIDSKDYVASTMLQRQYDMGFYAVSSVKSLLDGGTIRKKFEDTGVITAKIETLSDPSVVKVLETN